jgi:cyclophilin family peptidyl-prolyl cis-trans isomerase
VATLLTRLVDEYPDEVQLAYRHFPLDNIHDYAFLAAEASEAAGAQGQFWAYHDALYENQGELNALTDEAEVRAFLIDAADDLGLDVDQFTADLESGYADRVGEQQLGAIQAGLPGTPALIVNGQLLQGTPPFEAWEDFLAQLRQMAVLEDLQYDEPPAMSIDETKSYLATVEMENGDQFVIELYPQSAPLTVNNFVFLANEGWFDGVTFHRVLPEFVAQTGDPTGTGMGGPGYEIPNEVDPELTHAEVGMVAMANSGPDTNGSQWYVTLGDASFLDGGYTIFGKVIEGMDVVQAITPRDPQIDPNAPEGDRITTITIAEQ